MTNQNTLADLSSTAALNLNIKGQSQQGTAPASTIDSIFQKYGASLHDFYNSLGGVATVSGTDTYTVTITEDWAALASGLILAIKVPNANTGAATLNVTVPTAGALGAKAIRRQGDSALSANDMVANGVYLLRYASSYNSSAGAWVLLNQQPSSGGLTSSDLGKESIWVPAGAMNPRTTNGAARGSSEMATNKNMVVTLDFDSSTQEFAQFAIRMPKSWNEGTVTFIPVWSHAATTTNFGVVWGLDAVAVSDDDAMDVAFGTEQTSADTGGTTNDSYQGPESSAITIAGTPAAGDLVMYRIHRDPSDGSDTMAIDARLHGVLLLYTVDALSDT